MIQIRQLTLSFNFWKTYLPQRTFTHWWMDSCIKFLNFWNKPSNLFYNFSFNCSYIYCPIFQIAYSSYFWNFLAIRVFPRWCHVKFASSFCFLITLFAPTALEIMSYFELWSLQFIFLKPCAFSCINEETSKSSLLVETKTFFFYFLELMETYLQSLEASLRSHMFII